jgi:aminopeptidase N
VQHLLGLLDYDTTYWAAVTPHEISRQWWGSLVGFDGYRDQWMGEGFSNFSEGVFLRHTTTKMDEFRDFWQEQQSNLLQKNTQGVRPVDAGPLTMRPPATNTKSAQDVYRVMIYSKGAMVLHMLEMMYWNPTDLEETFKHSMQQFVTDYSGKEATTEDWKASMEKTLPKWLDLHGDGKLDWFFDEYVYGTELPRYTISSDFAVGGDGKTSCHLKLTQSNVSKNFVMLIPLYLELTDGQVARYRNVVMHGDDTLDQTIDLGKLPQPAKAMLVNYNADVLSGN